METTIFKNAERVTLYVGGDPKKGEVPEITIELIRPQVLVDSKTNIILIKETQ